MIKGQCSCHSATSSVQNAKCKGDGYRDRAEKEYGILPYDSVGLWRRPGQLVIRKEHEIQASGNFNNRMQQKRKGVEGYHGVLQGL